MTVGCARFVGQRLSGMGWGTAKRTHPTRYCSPRLRAEVRTDRQPLALSFGLPWACTSPILRGAAVPRTSKPRQSTSATPSVPCSSGPPPFLSEVAAEACITYEPKISLALSSNYIPVDFPPCPPLRGHGSHRFAFAVRLEPQDP